MAINSQSQNIAWKCYATLAVARFQESHSLLVLDPTLMLALDVFPCEDGHVQERSSLNQVQARCTGRGVD